MEHLRYIYFELFYGFYSELFTDFVYVTPETLEIRREKCNLITIYELKHRYYDVHTNEFTIFADIATRGHQYKLHMQYC